MSDRSPPPGDRSAKPPWRTLLHHATGEPSQEGAVGGRMRGFDRLLDAVPAGLELGSVRDLVDEDLAADAALGDLVDDLTPDLLRNRPEIPRIRPILVALSTRASGSSRVDDELQYAAELLHVGLVVHDLALGQQGAFRRRVARKLVRRSVDFLAGSALTLRALELVRNTNPSALGELVDTLREFSEGQALSRQLVRKSLSPNAEDWDTHADASTGALFAFCCRAGGVGAPAEVQRALSRYGRHVGRLWHIAEDVSALSLGDGGGHLVARAVAGRPVLPVCLAAEREPAVDRRWIALVRAPDHEVAQILAGDVLALGGVARAREVMARESWAARKALAAVPESKYRTAMERLAASLARANGLRDPAARD